MPNLYEALKGFLPEGKELTIETIKAAAEEVSKTGKFVPEAKFLEIKNENKTLTENKTKLEEQLKEFEGIDPKDAKEASEKYQALKDKIAADAKAAEEAAAADAAAKTQATVREAVIAKLKEAGAVDPELVVDKAITKAGGAEAIEFNEDGTIKTDIEFAINHVKTEHATNFTTVQTAGGASGAGAGAGTAGAWTPESAATRKAELSDQEVIDLAKEDSGFAKAAGLSAYESKED